MESKYQEALTAKEKEYQEIYERVVDATKSYYAGVLYGIEVAKYAIKEVEQKEKAADSKDLSTDEVVPEATKTDVEDSQRGQIRKAIYEAMEKRIDKFELIGDYNYKFLGKTARDAASTIFRGMYGQVIREVIKELREKWGEEYIATPIPSDYRRRAFRVHQQSGEDRPHTFVDIDYDFLGHLKEIVTEDTERGNGFGAEG